MSCKYRNFFLWKCFEVWTMVLHIDWSYRDQLIFLPIGISFYYIICNRIYDRCVLGKGKGRVQSGEDRIVSWILPDNRRRSDLQMGRCGKYFVLKSESVKAANVFKGSYRIIWGLFKKMIIADRLAVLVDKVYVGYESYSGAVIVAAAISYTIQLYMEFFGLYGYGHRKCRTFWNSSAGEFQPAVFCKDMYRFLETMAHYAWCLVQELYLLSSIHFQDGQKVE